MTLHESNVYNVETTLNLWLRTQVLAITRPAVLPAFTVVFNQPEGEMPTPAISVIHMAGDVRKPYQGNHVGGGQHGGKAFGIMDVSCWVSREDRRWNAQLMILRGMVAQVCAGAGSLRLSDYTTDVDNPTPVTYKVDLGELEGVETGNDPNPDIKRARFLLRYDWIVRQ